MPSVADLVTPSAAAISGAHRGLEIVEATDDVTIDVDGDETAVAMLDGADCDATVGDGVLRNGFRKAKSEIDQPLNLIALPGLRSVNALREARAFAGSHRSR